MDFTTFFVVLPCLAKLHTFSRSMSQDPRNHIYNQLINLLNDFNLTIRWNILVINVNGVITFSNAWTGWQQTRVSFLLFCNYNYYHYVYIMIWSFSNGDVTYSMQWSWFKIHGETIRTRGGRRRKANMRVWKMVARRTRSVARERLPTASYASPACATINGDVTVKGGKEGVNGRSDVQKGGLEISHARCVSSRRPCRTVALHPHLDVTDTSFRLLKGAFDTNAAADGVHFAGIHTVRFYLNQRVNLNFFFYEQNDFFKLLWFYLIVSIVTTIE